MQTIRSLAKSRIKYNKSRTILTFIAIMLTTVLLMGLGTSALGIFNMNKQNAAMLSNVHANISDVTYEQAQKLKNHLDVEAVEINEIFASVEYEKMNGYLGYGETLKDGIYYGFGSLIEGRQPKAENEICGPEAFFKRMNTEPVIGNKINISFRPDGTGAVQTKEFTICGIVSERDISNLNVSDSRIAYSASISDELVSRYFSKDERKFRASIRVFGENELTIDGIKEKIKGIAEDIGCKEDDISFNNQYIDTMLDPGTEIKQIAACIAFIIILFSALVIYSIYYVSVITDVQEIGKLKALGASDKQIKRLLLLESMRISAVAVPAGLAIGFLIPYFILPAVMNKVQKESGFTEIGHISMFSLPVLLLVAAAVIITVYISLIKPIRMAAKISPVEAIRYQESSRGKKIRKGNINVNVFRLSAANLMRNKRRTIVTMLTMGLSCVLFMSFAGVMNSMSAEDIARRNIPEGEFKLEIDCELNDKTYPENNWDSVQQQDLFSDGFIKELESIDGVEKTAGRQLVLVSSNYSSEIFEDERRTTLEPVTREKAEEYSKDVGYGEIDYDKMLAENGAILSLEPFWEEYGFSIGDTVKLTVYDGSNRISLNVKVHAAVADGYASVFMIPQELYEKLNMKFNSTNALYIHADKDKYDSVKSELQSISDSNQYFKLYSMDEELNIGGMGVNFTKYPMYVILIMIAVIGFMNLINTMITSIVTRKHELGVLQAIGLSDSQLKRMLAGEGLVFTAGTLAASLTLGNLIGYFVYLWAKENHFMSLTAYHYPITETICLAAALILGQLFVTYFINKRVHKESLIDRIRS
ncbi:MAG: FtsX-like permease family protein [Firmicutes bacterium]|nr:FtsX-like permease family protein [Bacillota bacterium]